METKWTILIATLGQRAERLQRLLQKLLPQVDDYEGQIDVLAYWNNFERPLSEIRQALVEESTGEYINFIDDDDLVADDYCARVMAAIETSPDYVGWQQQLYFNGEKTKPTYHSLRYSEWSDDADGYYRNVSHLNPIRREIAQKVSFLVPQGVPEDFTWAKRVAPLVETEAYVDSVMYHYYPSAEDSKWSGGTELKPYTRPDVMNLHFKWHPESRKSWEPQH